MGFLATFVQDLGLFSNQDTNQEKTQNRILCQEE